MSKSRVVHCQSSLERHVASQLSPVATNESRFTLRGKTVTASAYHAPGIRLKSNALITSHRTNLPMSENLTQTSEDVALYSSP